MVDDQQAQPQLTEEPVKETPESPMPSEEQKTPEPIEVKPPEVTEGLPEDAKERTKQEFEKMREKLREERTRREYLETVFNSMQTKKAEPEITPIYDPSTGLLDEKALTDVQRRTVAAEDRAKRAEEAVSSYLQDQENRETYAAFPELNPEAEKFNKTLHNLTRSIALDSMVNPTDYGGKQLSFKDAADIAKKTMGTSVEQIKKEAAKETLEQLTPKEQASLEATGSTTRRQQALGSLDELKRRTQKGDVNATIERLKRAGSSG